MPPVPPEERLASLDILRGVALFGVLAVNLDSGFRVSIFEQFLQDERPLTLPDWLAEAFVTYALELKAFALFSFLFGVGLAVQFERLSAGGRPLYWLARRLAVLLVLGLIHLLFIWNGDILTEYAVAGFFVLPLLLAPAWALAVISACMLALYVVMPMLPLPIPWPDEATLRLQAAEANRVYATGGFGEIWRFALGELPLVALLHVYVFARTLALFLLGALVWRSGVLRDLGRYKRELVLVAWIGIVVGFALTARGGAAERLGTVVLAMGYAAAVMTSAQALGLLAPVGRMAFTNYIMQSLVFGFIFFGYGLGQFGSIGAAQALAIGVAVYIAQMLMSAWWLRRFRFGPVEWLWRTLMYGKAQPLR